MDMQVKVCFTENQVHDIYDEVEKWANELREFAGLKDMEYLNALQHLCNGVRCALKTLAYDYPQARRLCEIEEARRDFFSDPYGGDPSSA